MITSEKLHQLGIGPEWVEPLKETFERFKINSVAQEARFIAQASHESNNFRALEENLNYRAETLMKLWPRRFPTMDEANKYARQPERIANHIYSSRMGNRDESSGDGFRFRGGGLFQLTGHDNYWHCGQALGIDLVMHPELVRQPRVAALSAGWFWSTHGCNQLAEAGDDVALTKKINGGTIGLDDRISKTHHALQVLA
jgi:putative chitinase